MVINTTCDSLESFRFTLAPLSVWAWEIPQTDYKAQTKYPIPLKIFLEECFVYLSKEWLGLLIAVTSCARYSCLVTCLIQAISINIYKLGEKSPTDCHWIFKVIFEVWQWFSIGQVNCHRLTQDAFYHHFIWVLRGRIGFFLIFIYEKTKKRKNRRLALRVLYVVRHHVPPTSAPLISRPPRKSMNCPVGRFPGKISIIWKFESWIWDLVSGGVWGGSNLVLSKIGVLFAVWSLDPLPTQLEPQHSTIHSTVYCSFVITQSFTYKNSIEFCTYYDSGINSGR